MDNLTDLWLVDTQNLDASELDLLLDNLAAIERIATEGILHITQADFDTLNTAGGGLLAVWDAELGHHVTIVPEADFNHDGIVDSGDFDAWQTGFGMTDSASHGDGDADGDGDVDGGDFIIWQRQFGVATDSQGNTAVPEPASITLLLTITFLALARCRVRRDF